MPFKSQAQRRFLYATNPKVAKKFSAHTPKGKKLPERVKEASLEKTALKKRLGKALEQAVRSSRRNYTPTDILAHELGHLKAFSKGPKALVKPRLFAYGMGPTLSRLGSMFVPATGKFSGKRTMIAAAGYAPRLAEEAAATYYGLKALKKLKYISPSMYRKGRSNLLKAYGTYAIDAAGGSLSAGAAGLTKDVGKQALINLGGSFAGPLVIQGSGLLGSLMRGVGKGGLSTRRQRKALAKSMGLPNAPFVKETKDFSGSALPKEMVDKDIMKLFGATNPIARKRAKKGGIVVLQGTNKSAYTGKKDVADRILDSLENFGRKLQA